MSRAATRALTLAAALAAAAAAPARALFEDLPGNARQAALGGPSAAAEDALGFLGNPALGGARRKFETGAAFLSTERTPQGAAELVSRGGWAVLPHGNYGRPGTFSAAALYRSGGGLLQRTLALGWSSWQLLRAGGGALDFGFNLRSLSAAQDPGPENQAGVAADLGAAWRPDGRRTWGLAALNLNSPSFEVGLLKDRAPRTLRLGYAEKHDDFTLFADLSAREASGGYAGRTGLAAGAEHMWRTLRAGEFFTRGGLYLAPGASAMSAGLGWRRQAAEFAYGLQVPLTGAIVPGHAVSASLRFGDRDTESEYERLIRQEMKYRQDLVEALDEAARREALLKKELASLREETDSLGGLLQMAEVRKEQVVQEKERLAGVVRRQQAAEAELKTLEEKRRTEKLSQLAYSFSLDWQNYLRLKGGGAPADVRKAALERLVGQYQASGIDISQATLELREVIAGR